MLRYSNALLVKSRRCSTRLPRVLRRSLVTSDSLLGLKPYYITTPIFYPNSVPHIGHLHSLVVADIFARYAKLENPHRPIRFVTGTDEHGLKIQKAAREKGMEPLAFCDELSQHFRELTRKANATVTDFARTSEQQHHDAVQHLWRRLDQGGYIYKGSHEGWYSISDECFYTNGQVTKLENQPQTDSEDSGTYISSETGSKVEWTQEENYKFRLSAFREHLLAHFNENPTAIFPAQHHTDIVATLTGPLDDLSVSRPSSRLSWGIPVPNDADHTIYVWIDALTTYLSAVGYPWRNANGSGVSSGWPPNLQIIGKDILRFHAIYFPAMLLALDLPLPKQLLSHSHWTVDQRKMSKSIGNVADPIQAIDEHGLDVVRYYLARVGGRFKDDVDWSTSQLEKHSREITSLLGNLYLRITSQKIEARANGHTSLSSLFGAVTEDTHPAFPTLSAVGALKTKVSSNMENLLVADALDTIISALQEANLLMTQTAPWSPKTPSETVVIVRAAILECLRVCGILLQPFIPGKAGDLLDALDVPDSRRSLEYAEMGKAFVGNVKPGVRLFDKPVSS